MRRVGENTLVLALAWDKPVWVFTISHNIFETGTHVPQAGKELMAILWPQLPELRLQAWGTVIS